MATTLNAGLFTVDDPFSSRDRPVSYALTDPSITPPATENFELLDSRKLSNVDPFEPITDQNQEHKTPDHSNHGVSDFHPVQAIKATATAVMARPSLRPRGESDLGRPATGHYDKVANGSSVRSQNDVHADSELASNPRQILSGILLPLPWIFASASFEAHTSSSSTSSPLAETSESNKIHKAIWLASVASSITLLCVSAIWRIKSIGTEQTGRPRFNRQKTRTRRKNDVKFWIPVAQRGLGVWLMFFSVMLLGGFVSSLLMVLILSTGMGTWIFQQSASNILKDCQRYQLTLVATGLIFLGSAAAHLFSGAYAPLVGYTTFLAAVLLIPSSLLAIRKFSSPDQPWGKQIDAASPLLATADNREHTAWAGYVSALLTIVLYLLSFSSTVPSGAAFWSVDLAIFSACALIYCVRNTHFQHQDSLALKTSCLVLILSSFWSKSYPSFFVHTGAVILAFSCSFLDHTPKNQAHHDHSHDSKHSHSTHLHTPSNTQHSRFTGYVLTYTTPGSVINTIVSERDSRRIAYFGCLNLAFMLVQFFYGFVTGSLGLLTDSIHMLFDCLGLAVGLAAAVMSKWPPSLNFPYGYAKIDTLSGFANGIFLVLVSVEIVFDAIHRLREGYELRRLNELLIVSTLGFLVNIVGLTAFGHAHHHGHSHDHSHDHSHEHENGHAHGNSHDHSDSKHEHTANGHSHASQPSDTGHGHHHHNENMEGIFLHIMADALGSVAVIISTLLTKYSSWHGWDPLASCIIAILIFFSALPLVKSSGTRLLMSLPNDAEYKCRGALQGISDLVDVIGYSGVRLWLKDVENETEDHSHSHSHDHDHGHKHSHKKSPSHDHDHEHSHPHNHDHSHDHHNHKGENGHANTHNHTATFPSTSPSTKPTWIFGTMHIIATRNAEMDLVRTRVDAYLRSHGMDMVVHVEHEGDRCWCGGGQTYSPRKGSAPAP
ncbi:cation efflux protein [Microthyrium microscopicum]|uniref:Zinc transporter n=1 Tax=Microthyrium microscopicum TaxID=703497 RepID=A0A6A6UGZ8_9PEZI|nr:cation efflux protein [Microthyrium microscopicum]